MQYIQKNIFKILFVIATLFFAVQYVYAGPALTYSGLTFSSITLQATALSPNTEYDLEIYPTAPVGLNEGFQTFTADGSGVAMFTFSGLRENQNYRARLYLHDSETPLSFVDFYTPSEHLSYSGLSSTQVTIQANSTQPGSMYTFTVWKITDQANDIEQNVTANSTVTTSQFTNLEPGTTYTAKVYSFVQGGSSYSSYIDFTTPVQNNGGEPDTTPDNDGGEPDTTGGENDGEPDTTPTGGDGDSSGGENNDGGEEGVGNDIDNGPAFGDGVSLLTPNSGIANVPMISWNDQLAFRLRTQANDVTIFGFSLEDLQNGNFNPANFSLENLSNFDFNFIDALNLQNLLSGNIEIGDTNISGIEIQGVQFVYDFFYDISANINFNGRSYSKVTAYFGRYPEQLTKKVAEYTNVSGSLLIEGKIYNSNNNNENEVVKEPMFVGRSYYLGIYGEYDDNGTLRSETIAIKRLPEYVARPVDANRISVFWSAPPYMSINGNSVKFSLAGTIDSRNMVRDATTLKFGEGSYTFKNIGLYPASMGPDISFARTLENVYTNADTFTTLPLLPGKMYYAGIYEGEELVSFIQVGRTPTFLVSQDPETTPTGGGGDEGQDPLFNQDPFADLAQDLESGIVPCDGLNVECDYNKAIELIERGINFLFIMIIPIAAIAFAYAGFLLLFQGSSPEKRKQARDIFIKVFIGIVIVLAAWLIIKTILVSLGVDQENIWLDLSNTQ